MVSGAGLQIAIIALILAIALRSPGKVKLEELANYCASVRSGNRRWKSDLGVKPNWQC